MVAVVMVGSLMTRPSKRVGLKIPVTAGRHYRALGKGRYVRASRRQRRGYAGALSSAHNRPLRDSDGLTQAIVDLGRLSIVCWLPGD